MILPEGAVILPEADWRRRPGMATLLDALSAGAGETRFVGGCVRDTLLALPVSDVDLATRLLPAEVMARLRAAGIKAVPTGLAHGTVTAVIAGVPVEVTTLRRDVATDGRHATVAFTDDWAADAARRDFTINALSAEPGSGVVRDYHGGILDLAERRVRFIGDPLTRIAEDHLRILRFFRFHARFGTGPPDPAGLAACAERANDLLALSRERIAGELLRLLALPDPVTTVAIMVEYSILGPVLPEIEGGGLAPLVALEREAGIAPEPVRRLASLLPPDPAVAEAVAARLRLSNEARRRLVALRDPGAWRAGSAEQRRHGITAHEAIDRLLLAGEPAGLIRDHRSIYAAAAPPHFALKGGDLIALGLPRGPLVSQTLLAIERSWVDEDFPDANRLRAIARDQVAAALRSSQ